jgi:hypothetical protein
VFELIRRFGYNNIWSEIFRLAFKPVAGRPMKWALKRFCFLLRLWAKGRQQSVIARGKNRQQKNLSF